MPLWRKRRPKQEKSLRRRFVTPEGVDLGLVLGDGGARASAFMLDMLMMLAVLIGASLLLFLLDQDNRRGPALIIWLLGAFLLRNGWFILFEMGGRAATPGKRMMGLRVVARDGGRLTASAIFARNAVREVEIFLPLSFLVAQSADGTASVFLSIFALLWTGIFMFFPLMNRDRLRIGDLLAGTWVIQKVTPMLGIDLGRSSADAANRRTFSDAALGLYGEFELHTLEDVLRRDDGMAIATVAGAIRHKVGLPHEADDRGFLEDYYAALCERLERGMLLGSRRADKTERLSRAV